MPEFDRLPQNWTEIEYELGDHVVNVRNGRALNAEWQSDQYACRVTIHMHEDFSEDQPVYRMNAYQTLRYDGDEFEAEAVETELLTHTRVAHNRREAELTAIEFMHEFNKGHHHVHCLGVERYQKFVNFYTVEEDKVPGDLDSRELVDVIASGEWLDDQIEADEIDEDEAVNLEVDIRPQFEYEVTFIESDEE